MKKLRNKIFLVIFSLLTTFTTVIFFTSITRVYIERKHTVSDMLTKVPRNFDYMGNKNENNDPAFTPSNKRFEQDSRRIYLDFNIYTIVLDDNGNYEELINHTNNDVVDEDYIKNIADRIISSHEEDFYVGNLYTSNYAYAFAPNNTLVIMDNTDLNKFLVNNLISNILLFLVCEIVLFIFTYLITKWIITPVKNSFEKQKIFVADASHELKTPLSVMVASVDAYFNDKNDKWVRNMKTESERMIKLVTELLDLAKTEEEQDIVMKQNDLSNVIEGALLTFESLFYDNKIKLEYDISPNVKMLFNENLIIELVGILIDNAIKHCSSKGEVIVNLFKNNKQIVLEVKNTGLPIKKEDEERIFERFYKVDTSRNRNSNNYGLGLSIAKNIVERHNGKIKAYSYNGYTIFKVVWNQK